MMILGEITVLEWDWIKGAFLALPTIASIVAAWAVLSGKGKVPQPLQVQGQTRMATWEELNEVAQSVDQLEVDLKGMRREMHQMERRLSKEGKDRVGALHRRMDDMQKDVGSVPARTAALFKDMKGLLP